MRGERERDGDVAGGAKFEGLQGPEGRSQDTERRLAAGARSHAQEKTPAAARPQRQRQRRLSYPYFVYLYFSFIEASKLCRCLFLPMGNLANSRPTSWHY